MKRPDEKTEIPKEMLRLSWRLGAHSAHLLLVLTLVDHFRYYRPDLNFLVQSISMQAFALRIEAVASMDRYVQNRHHAFCQRKYCLGATFPGSYTEDEMNHFFVDSHANILGLTVEEYHKEREKYPKGKKMFLGEDD